MTKTISAIAVLITLAFSSSASAATVNIGSQAGLFDLSHLVFTQNNRYASLSLDGTIAAHTSVAFTYDLDSLSGTDGNGPALLFGQGKYNFYQNSAGNVVYSLTEGYSNYYGTTVRNAIQGQASIGKEFGLYGDPANLSSHKSLLLLTSSANISPDGSTGTFTLTNTSDAMATYFTQFSSTVSGLRRASYTYQVTPMSSVPLPAALPLFGGAVLAFGAFRSKKRKS